MSVSYLETKVVADSLELEKLIEAVPTHSRHRLSYSGAYVTEGTAFPPSLIKSSED